jgi:hypothetical protein
MIKDRDRARAMRTKTILLAAAACFCAVSCGGRQAEEPGKAESNMEKEMEAKLRQFAPTEIGVEEAAIPPRIRPLLRKIIEAGQRIDRLFFLQVARENPRWLSEIEADPGLKNTLAYFGIMYGPWDRLDRNRPFWGARGQIK